MNSIGSKIQELRKRKGLTQENLSELSNINLRTLQRIEKGTSEPRSDTLKNICKALEVNMEDLLDYRKKNDLEFLKYLHLSVLTCMFFPLGNVILPLILWLTKRNQIIDLEEQGRNLLNYQILWSIIIYITLTLWGIFFINHWTNGTLLLFALGALYLSNIVYPIVIVIFLKKGIRKNFYINPFRFIR